MRGHIRRRCVCLRCVCLWCVCLRCVCLRCVLLQRRSVDDFGRKVNSSRHDVEARGRVIESDAGRFLHSVCGEAHIGVLEVLRLIGVTNRVAIVCVASDDEMRMLSAVSGRQSCAVL